jgi:hypothetical protein
MINDTLDTNGGGNTKTPPSKEFKARRWVFTLNNWTEEEYDTMLQHFESHKCLYVIGKEEGTQGTPHLQGYIERKNPIRMSTLKKWIPRAHFEKAKGDRNQNKAYCTKDNNYTSNLPKSLKEICMDEYIDTQWKPWQADILDIITTKPDNRTVHWFWESKGNTGKSFLCKYLWLKYNAIIAEGNKNDIFNQIKIWIDSNEGKSPSLVLIDIPRTAMDYVSYTTIEKVKNGLIYSGKYEGGVCCFPSPHLICFANTPPRHNALSMDRWNIVEIR